MQSRYNRYPLFARLKIDIKRSLFRMMHMYQINAEGRKDVSEGFCQRALGGREKDGCGPIGN